GAERAGQLPHPGAVRRPAFGAGADVVKHELVRSVSCVHGSKFGNVAHVDVIPEPDAFDDPAVTHVQAGDELKRPHEPASVFTPRTAANSGMPVGLSSSGSASSSNASMTRPPRNSAPK